MSDNTLIYPIGSILVFSTGGYAEYDLAGFVVTLKPCDLRALVDEFMDTYKPTDEWDKPLPEGFVGWLVANGHAMPVDSSLVHLDSYWRI